jgi:SSS family solute:Na+ symporter
MIINDLYLPVAKKKLSDKTTIFATRLCNVISAAIAMVISLGKVDIVTMNTFAFAIRCSGPFAAYGLGMVVPKATKHSGIFSIIAGTIGVVVWQMLGKGNFYLGVLPVVFGCLCGVVVFFLINLVEWKLGVKPAPSAFLSEEEVSKIIAEENVSLL